MQQRGDRVAYSEAQKKATLKYRKENYSRISLDLKKDKKEKYKAQAERRGMTLNAYIVSLLEADGETMKDWIYTFKPYAPQGMTATEYPTGTHFPNFFRIIGGDIPWSGTHRWPRLASSIHTHPGPTCGGPLHHPGNEYHPWQPLETVLYWQKEEESTLKKKLTPKSIIVAALALILAVSMFGCSKDTTAAEDKTEKTVSTEKVETVQEKAEEPTAELLSNTNTENGTVETVDGSGLQDTEVPEDTTVEAQTPDEPEVNPNFDYAAIYADLCENHPDTASALNAAIMSIPDLLEKEDVVPLTEKYLSNTEHDPAAAPGLVDYLLEKQSSDSTTSTNTSTNTSNTNTTTSKPTTNTNTSTATSKPSTNTNNNNSTNTSTSQPSTNTNNNSTNTSTSQPSDSSSDDDFDKMLQDAIDRGVLGEGTGAEMKYGETIDASNDTVADWAGGEVIFGDNGTITVIRP